MTSEMLLADQYLRVVQSRGERTLPLNRVYRNMRRRGLFLKAYAKIYANAGATTVGTDPQDTIQGMSVARIDEIVAQLHDGTYQWKPSRRVYVPKRNGSQRPISIPNWSDKLVQEVMRMILEAYYEPQFRESSHGFRPNRGCHTALQEIKRKWTGTKWFIEGDIKGCFDNLSFEVIVRLLSRNIHDNRFLKLIVKDMLRAGYVDDWKYHQTQSGAPQGGIISPIISNIVLHELDSYVEDVLIPQNTAGKRRRHNREYYRLSRKKSRAKQRGEKSLYRELSKQQRTLPEGDPNDPGFRRLRYIRYADDFLLGVVGTKVDARNIKSQLAVHLKSLGLTLSQEKTYITHASTEAARFLGYEISTTQADSKITKGIDNVKRRSVNGVIQLQVSTEVKTKWLRRYTRHGKPHQIGGYIELTDYEIVETFGAQLRGLATFYSLADNIGVALRHVRWVCLESARKTLAAKHNIRKPSVTYRQYYRDGIDQLEWRHLQVVVERENGSPLVAKCGETPLRTRKTSFISDKIPPKVVAGTTSELLTRLLAGKCELCQRTSDLEAHHVNKLKNLRRRWQDKPHKPKWVEHMIARRRKTVVVCHECHQQITHARYDGQRVN